MKYDIGVYDNTDFPDMEAHVLAKIVKSGSRAPLLIGFLQRKSDEFVVPMMWMAETGRTSTPVPDEYEGCNLVPKDDLWAKVTVPSDRKTARQIVDYVETSDDLKARMLQVALPITCKDIADARKLLNFLKENPDV